MRGISMNSDGARGCEFCLTDRGRGHNMIAVEGRGWVCDVCGWKPLDADRECQREPDEVEQGGAWVLRGRGIRASRKRLSDSTGSLVASDSTPSRPPQKTYTSAPNSAPRSIAFMVFCSV